MRKIGLINYGLGNLTSVMNVLDYFSIPYEVVNHTDTLFNKFFDGYILPGVGSFKHAMDTINSSGIGEYVIQEVKYKDKPILGICLGMQLLMESSTEGGKSKGLGLIDGSVVEFNNDSFNVPHVGWNQVTVNKKNLLINNNNADYYFDHSFYVNTSIDNIAGTAKYITTFPAIINKDKIYGVQFHPEKSQIYGAEIINNFANFCLERNA